MAGTGATFRRACRTAVIPALLGLAGSVALSSAASASVYHVRVGGTRTAGASMPWDWSLPNCYPDLVSGAAAASAPDSLLLFDEDHAVATWVVIPAFLGNPRLDGNRSSCRVVLGANGQLRVDAASHHFEARGVTLTENASSSDRAAFLVHDPGGALRSVSFTDCRFSGNLGSDALLPGGSCLTGLPLAGTLTVRFLRCELDSNSTDGPGGAVHVGDGYDLRFEQTTLRDNVSRRGTAGEYGRGGAVAVVSPWVASSLKVADSFVSGNRAWGPGGALYLINSDVSLFRSEISDNRSAVGGITSWAAGGGVHAALASPLGPSSQFVADSCVFRRNSQDLSLGDLAGDGGAILVKGYSGRLVNVNVSNCLFESNFAAQGAGLYIGRFAVGTVRRCRFWDNRAQQQGGATFKGGALAENEGETASYEYCEFLRNEAGLTEQGASAPTLGRGGAFATRTHPRAEFTNCTFVDNVVYGPDHQGDAFSQNDGDGPLDADSKRCALRNCVFYGTSGNDVQVRSAANGFTVVEHCAWEPGEFVCDGIVPGHTVLLSGSPFESLTDPRPFFGSPLVDAAVDVGLSADIEGNPVPDGPSPDIGAYEGMSPVWAPPPDRGGAPALASRPNPFAATMTVHYELPRAGFVELDVFDVAGRRVAVLDRGVRGAGRRQVLWTARDDAGRDVGSGVYWIRLRAGGEETVRSVVFRRQ